MFNTKSVDGRKASKKWDLLIHASSNWTISRFLTSHDIRSANLPFSAFKDSLVTQVTSYVSPDWALAVVWIEMSVWTIVMTEQMGHCWSVKDYVLIRNASHKLYEKIRMIWRLIMTRSYYTHWALLLRSVLHWCMDNICYFAIRILMFSCKHCQHTKFDACSTREANRQSRIICCSSAPSLLSIIHDWCWIKNLCIIESDSGRCKSSACLILLCFRIMLIISHTKWVL